jgi:hypothetical protein
MYVLYCNRLTFLALLQKLSLLVYHHYINATFAFDIRVIKILSWKNSLVI